MPDTDTEADGLIEGLGLDVELIVPDAELETVCVPDVDGEDVPDTDAEADAEEEEVGVGTCPAVCSNKSKSDTHIRYTILLQQMRVTRPETLLYSILFRY